MSQEQKVETLGQHKNSGVLIKTNREVSNLMPVKNYRDDLLNRLSEPEYSSRYLKAALDETLQDGNMEAFLLALKNIVDATRTVQEVTSETALSKQHIYHLLSGKSNPTLETLAVVLNAVGLTIDFKPLVKRI